MTPLKRLILAISHDASSPNNRDIKSQFNNWDVALSGGIGYQFSNGFNITAAYDHGLSKVNSGQSVEAYNQALKIGVGFRF